MRLLCLSVLLISCGHTTFSQTGKAQTQASLKKGDDAMMERKWHDAELAYQSAADSDPTSADAHSKLSNALVLQLRPGPITSPENRPLLARALSEQQRAADLVPGDSKVVSQLARIQDAVARSSQEPDEQTRNRNLAAQNYLRAIQSAPDDSYLHFQLADMELFTAAHAINAARSGTKDPTAGTLIRDESLRQSLALLYTPTLEDSIAHSEKVLEWQKNNSFAMLLAALGYFLRAGLAPSQTEFARDTNLANQCEGRFRTQWGRNYSPEMERNMIATLLSPRVGIANDPTNAAGVIGGIIGGVTPPPPPPPGLTDGPTRIGGQVAEANLVKKVQPVYPPAAKAARVCGLVEFLTSIDETGRVRNLQLVRGHPLLVPAAKDAVIQWEYRPVTFNGKPIDVITNVIVNFTLEGWPCPSAKPASPGDVAPDTGPPKSQ